MEKFADEGTMEDDMDGECRVDSAQSRFLRTDDGDDIKLAHFRVRCILYCSSY